MPYKQPYRPLKRSRRIRAVSIAVIVLAVVVMGVAILYIALRTDALRAFLVVSASVEGLLLLTLSTLMFREYRHWKATAEWIASSGLLGKPPL